VLQRREGKIAHYRNSGRGKGKNAVEHAFKEDIGGGCEGMGKEILPKRFE